MLFEEVAPRYEDRPGGYTRVLRLAEPRLGDAGTQSDPRVRRRKNDRVVDKAAKPAFDAPDDEPVDEAPADEVAAVASG